ncbi:MAG: inositol monophosphatase family protein [Nanoarchaeota archaeon]|nr:inositol monophosphatase family protein [Nanoarchaeota archaeon]
MFKDVAIQASTEAGKILMDNLGNVKSLKLKQKNDYVSNVDIEVEDKIKEIIKSHFPEHNIVAEESDVRKRESKYTWFVDPISSTDNYIHSLPHFAVSIALQEHGITILGVVLDPFYNELFYAEKNKGAYLHDSKIEVSSVSDISKSILCVGIHNKGGADTEEGLIYFRKILSAQASVRRIGSTALQMCYVACGRIEAHVNNSSDLFVIPSGKLILEEAGGIVTDFKNDIWNNDSKSILASNGKVHSALVKILKT